MGNSISFDFSHKAREPIESFLSDMDVNTTAFICPYRHEYYRYLELKKLFEKRGMFEEESLSSYSRDVQILVGLIKDYDGKIFWGDGAEWKIYGIIKYIPDHLSTTEDRILIRQNSYTFTNEDVNIKQSMKLAIYESIIVILNRIMTNVLESRNIMTFNDTLTILNEIDPKFPPYDLTHVENLSFRINSDNGETAITISDSRFEETIRFLNLNPPMIKI